MADDQNQQTMEAPEQLTGNAPQITDQELRAFLISLAKKIDLTSSVEGEPASSSLFPAPSFPEGPRVAFAYTLLSSLLGRGGAAAGVPLAKVTTSNKALSFDVLHGATAAQVTLSNGISSKTEYVESLVAGQPKEVPNWSDGELIDSIVLLTDRTGAAVAIGYLVD